MALLVQNTSNITEFVDIHNPKTGAKDTVTVMPGSKVELPHNFRVSPVVVNRPHILVTGNDSPVSPLD